MVRKWVPLINGVYWGYNPLTNLLPTSWDILVVSWYRMFLQIPVLHFLKKKTFFRPKLLQPSPMKVYEAGIEQWG